MTEIPLTESPSFRSPSGIPEEGTVPVLSKMGLDGTWRFLADAENRGKALRWFDGLSGGEEILTDRPWEYWFPEYDGVGWYERTFLLPSGWSEEMVWVCFEAVSYFCEVWVNGTFVGAHEGGFTPFSLAIDEGVLTHGENRIVVRVVNPPSEREVDGFRSGAPLNQSNLPIGKSAWYYNTGGIWQAVRLEVRPRIGFEWLHVFPNLEANQLEVRMRIRNHLSTTSARVRIEVFPEGLTEAVVSFEREFQVDAGGQESRIELPLNGRTLALWTLDHPVLHRLEATLNVGVQQDHVAESFGMREFTIQGNQFHLNGVPIVLKGVLQQGIYPRTLIIPDGRRQAMRELLLLKRNGFNFLRIHLKPAPSWYLDLTDRMGILVMHEPPIGWIANSSTTLDRCRREVRELIVRDANHPSIISWCILNESFHLLGYELEEICRLSLDLAHEAQILDPSRLIINASGGDASTVVGGPDTMLHDTSDVHLKAQAYLPWREAPVSIADAHVYCPYPAAHRTEEQYRTLRSPYALFISEYGAPETPPDFPAVLGRYTEAEASRGIEDWKLHRDFYSSLEQAFERSGLDISLGEFIREVNRMRAEEVRGITHALRSNPQVIGYCFCQLADASGELFGLTDVWRRPKPVFHALAEAICNPAVSLSLPIRGILASDALEVRCALIADDASAICGCVTLMISTGDGQQVWSQAFAVDGNGPVLPVFSGAVYADFQSGLYNLRAEFSENSGRKSVHSLEFLVLPDEQKIGPIGLRAPGSELEEFFRSRGVSVETFGNNYRLKERPVFLSLDGLPENRLIYAELFGQLRKVVELGGCAVLLGAEVHALYRILFPFHIRPQGVMRTCAYTVRHAVFDGLPSGGVLGAIHADIHSEKLDRAEDILDAGGEILAGAFSMNMWTRPANYFWGASLYRIPIGKGNVIVCNLNLKNLGTSRVADRLLHNLAHYAASLIQPGGEEYLLARCIDPLPIPLSVEITKEVQLERLGSSSG